MWTKGNSNSTPSLPRIDPQGQIRSSAQRSSWSDAQGQTADLNATLSQNSIYNTSEGEWQKHSRPSRHVGKQPWNEPSDKLLAWFRNEHSDLNAQASQLRGVLINELRPSVNHLGGQCSSIDSRIAAVEKSLQLLGSNLGLRLDGIEKKAKSTEDQLRKNLSAASLQQANPKADERIHKQIRELQNSLYEVRTELQRVALHSRISTEDSGKQLSVADRVIPEVKTRAVVGEQIARVEERLNGQKESQKQTVESLQRMLTQELREFRQEFELQWTKIRAEQRQLSEEVRGSVRDVVDEQLARAQPKSTVAAADAVDASPARQRFLAAEIAPRSTREHASVAQLDQLREQEESARKGFEVRIAYLESELTWVSAAARVDAATDVARSVVTHDMRAEDRRVLQQTEARLEEVENRLRDSIFRVTSDMQGQLSGHEAQLLKSNSEIAALLSEMDVARGHRANQADAIREARSHCEEVEKSLMRHIAQQQYDAQHTFQLQIGEINDKFNLLAKRTAQAEAVTEDCRGHCERRLRALSTMIADTVESLKGSVHSVEQQLRAVNEADTSTRARLVQVETNGARLPAFLLEELESRSKQLKRNFQAHRQGVEDELAGLHAAVAELAMAASEAGESWRRAHESFEHRWSDELVARTAVMQKATFEHVDKTLDMANSVRLLSETQQLEALQGRLGSLEAVLMAQLRQGLATIEQEIVIVESRGEVLVREMAGRAVITSEARSLEILKDLERRLQRSLGVKIEASEIARPQGNEALVKAMEISISTPDHPGDNDTGSRSVTPPATWLQRQVSGAAGSDIPRGPAFAALQGKVAELPGREDVAGSDIPRGPAGEEAAARVAEEEAKRKLFDRLAGAAASGDLQNSFAALQRKVAELPGREDLMPDATVKQKVCLAFLQSAKSGLLASALEKSKADRETVDQSGSSNSLEPHTSTAVYESFADWHSYELFSESGQLNDNILASMIVSSAIVVGLDAEDPGKNEEELEEV